MAVLSLTAEFPYPRDTRELSILNQLTIFAEVNGCGVLAGLTIMNPLELAIRTGIETMRIAINDTDESYEQYTGASVPASKINSYS